MNKRVERDAANYVKHVVEQYGVESALARTRRMTHEHRPNRQPQWLTRSIDILTQIVQSETQSEEPRMIQRRIEFTSMDGAVAHLIGQDFRQTETCEWTRQDDDARASIERLSWSVRVCISSRT